MTEERQRWVDFFINVKYKEEEIEKMGDDGEEEQSTKETTKMGTEIGKKRKVD